jgi:uncharacterized membrane protein YccC
MCPRWDLAARQVQHGPIVRSRVVLESAAERSRVTVRDRLERLRTLGPTLLLGAVGAGIAWAIASGLLGRGGAFFAPVAAIIALGLTVGQRLNRAIEVSVGVPLGIVLAELLVRVIGSGTPQLVVIVLLATAVSVFLGGGPLLVTQAAVSGILVVTLQQPSSNLPFTRAGDALIGCSVALFLNFVVAPIDPLRLARRAAEPVVRELAGTLGDLAEALHRRDRDAAVAALQRARAIDVHTQRFLEALTIGREMAVAAPQRRGARGPLAVYSEAGGQIDLAVRDVRVLARGVLRAVELGEAVPAVVVNAIRALGQAVSNLDPWLDDRGTASGIVDQAVRAARDANAALEQTTNLSASAIVAQVRATAVDLLRSTGMGPDEARALVRGTPDAMADA